MSENISVGPHRRTSALAVHHIDARDAETARELAEAFLLERPDAPLEQRLLRAVILSHRLPEAIRTRVVAMRLADPPPGGLVLRGFHVLEDILCPTPVRLGRTPPCTESGLADALLLLIASATGDPVAHVGVHGGRVIVDVHAVAGDEDTQLGSGSTAELAWHTEDAYHPYRADWVVLLCLRNPQRVATTFAEVDDLSLPEEVRETLHQRRFVICPDSSHGTAVAHREHTVSVLSGNIERPFIQADRAFMRARTGDEIADRAWRTIVAEIDQKIQDVVLASGDVLIVNNRRAVHGRRPYVARYDGTGRWLRVVNTVADLQRSAGFRTGPHGRALRFLG